MLNIKPSHIRRTRQILINHLKRPMSKEELIEELKRNLTEKDKILVDLLVLEIEIQEKKKLLKSIKI